MPQRMSLEPLNLEELKSAARSQNRKVIRRDGEAGWRPVQHWNGSSRDKAVYYLLGDKVLSTSRHAAIEWYTLW
jgi:hypothetical protein